MTNKLRALSFLAPLILLVGCGTANVDDPTIEENEDDIAPRILKMTLDGSPINSSAIKADDINFSKLTIQFNEPVNVASLFTDPTNQTGIKPVDIQPTINGDWSYDKNTNTLSFTVANNANIGYGKSYTITIDNTIVDLADNALTTSTNFTLTTPTASKVSVNVAGLLNTATLDVILKRTGMTNATTTVTGSGSGTDSATFDADLAEGTTYSISLGATSNGQVCRSSGTNFTMGKTATTVSINCSDVLPQFTNAPNWNDYLQGTIYDAPAADQAVCTNSSSDCFHGGEYRVYNVDSSITSCAGLTISDKLDAFDWTCVEDAGSVKAVSTGLKPGATLTDLISFTNPNDATDDTYAAWAPNKVIVKNGSNTTVDESTLGVWWNNTVYTNLKGSLTASGAIYVYTKYNFEYTNFTSGAQGKIALVVKPGVSLIGTVQMGVSSGGIKPFVWIEGSIDASDKTDPALYLEATRFAKLVNVSVVNGTSDGIVFKKTDETHASNISVANAGGAGIRITGGQDGYYEKLTLANNAGHGLVAEKSPYTGGIGNIIQRVNSFNNGGNGVEIDQVVNNVFTEITATSNVQDGVNLSCSGCAFPNGTDNNFLSNITSANNGGNGITIEGSRLTDNTVNSALASLNAGIGFSLVDSVGVSITYSAASHNATNCTIGVDTACPAEVVVDDTTGILDSAFLGPVAASNVAYNDMTASQWTQQDNLFQAWANAGTDLVNNANGGACGTNETCVRMDWSLKEGNPFPNTITGSVGQHSFFNGGSSGPAINILADAVEIIGDGIGNDNGLCEKDAGETCRDAFNIGSYQP